MHPQAENQSLKVDKSSSCIYEQANRKALSLITPPGKKMNYGTGSRRVTKTGNISIYTRKQTINLSRSKKSNSYMYEQASRGENSIVRYR